MTRDQRLSYQSRQSATAICYRNFIAIQKKKK